MAGKDILIVDDSLDLQSLLESVLIREGYAAHCVSSGREALEWLRAASTLPDLILLDLMMPDIDGYEFRELQAKDSRLASIPVIVMTADVDAVAILKHTRAQGLLNKPFLNIDSILHAVRRFI